MSNEFTYLLQRFVEADSAYKRLKAESKDAKMERDEIEERLREHFIDQGVQNMKVNGVTVYLYSQKWAGVQRDDEDRRTATDEERERAIQALRDAGLGWMVKEDFNTQTLSAWVRELDELPPEFEGAINVTERTELRTRKG